MNLNWIIPAFVIVDTPFMAAKYCLNNHKLALRFMYQLHYLSGEISHLRFTLQLHIVLFCAYCAYTALTFGVATLSYYFVEAPVLRWRNRVYPE